VWLWSVGSLIVFDLLVHQTEADASGPSVAVVPDAVPSTGAPASEPAVIVSR